MKKLNAFIDIIYEFKASDELLKSSYEEVLKLDFYQNTHNKISIPNIKQKEEKQENLNLLYNPKFNDLHKWFNECLAMVAKDVGYKGEHKVIHSWANKSKKNERHHVHSHPMSIISGVFYLTTSLEGKGGETYYIYDSPSWDKCFLKHNNYHYFYVRPEAGKLILFPGLLSHGCEPNDDESTRYTIAFDSFPSGEVANMKEDTIKLKIDF